MLALKHVRGKTPDALSRPGVGNFSSRRTRFTEKKFFVGHSIFAKLYFKIKKIYISAMCNDINIKQVAQFTHKQKRAHL